MFTNFELLRNHKSAVILAFFPCPTVEIVGANSTRGLDKIFVRDDVKRLFFVSHYNNEVMNAAGNAWKRRERHHEFAERQERIPINWLPSISFRQPVQSAHIMILHLIVSGERSVFKQVLKIDHISGGFTELLQYEAI